MIGCAKIDLQRRHCGRPAAAFSLLPGLRALRKAVQFKPEFAEAHRDLGDLLAQTGQRAEALDTCKPPSGSIRRTR
jgi:hypothetical protein